MDAFGFDPPSLDDAAVATILRDHWGIVGSTREVRGERSHNRIVDTATARFVLHVVSASELPGVVDLQTEAIAHLARVAPTIPVPHPQPTLAGPLLATVEHAGQRHLARLVTYLDGEPYDDAHPLAASDYHAIGTLLGQIAAALETFDHRDADHFMAWDIANGLIVDDELRSVVVHPAAAKAMADVDDRLRTAAGALAALPRRIIHNDGHAGNLLGVRHDGYGSGSGSGSGDGPPRGVIDFGDIVRTATICDVAIAVASFATRHADPSRVVAEIAAGYHAQVPLSVPEIDVLVDVALAREALGLMLGSYQIAQSPHLAAEESAMLTDRIARLEWWAALDPQPVLDAVHERLHP